jgi:lipoprotein-anchoring transpeptidase ErfK/SrfK
MFFSPEFPRKSVPSAAGAGLSRRALIAGLPLLLAGCAGGGASYGSLQDGGFTVAAVDMTNMDSSLARTEVPWKGKEKPGSIVVNVPERRLYLVQAGGRALRYGVGVGRTEGMNFRGTAIIGRKEKWPHWTPTSNMIAATIRSGPARSIFTATARTRSSACTAPPNRRPSARRCRPAASACSTRTSSTCTTASPSARA